MKVTVFGSGYVGLVTAACLADAGNDIVCVDVDERKVEMLSRGEVPIHEPGLEPIVQRNLASGRLSFTRDAALGVAHGVFQLIAVGTPPDEDVSADLRHVLAVARTIGEHMREYKLVITKSTVPVGTGDRVRATLRSSLARRGVTIEHDTVSNPEFLKEGAAIADFVKPDRIVVGADSERAAQLMRALYEPFTRNHNRMLVMDVRSAELTKYAANAMLATRISFMNELANLAEQVGADIESVRHGIGSDPRIGYAFIYPGIGYGGSCFPKDVKALMRSATDAGCATTILEAVEAVNERQKGRLFAKIASHFGDLAGRTIAVWGLAFKPNTDDMRDAASRVLLESLWAAGASVRAYDPAAMPEARRLYEQQSGLELCASAMEALDGADALAIVTEWPEFRSPDFCAIRKALHEPVVFDGRNLYDPQQMTDEGLRYYAIGRHQPGARASSAMIAAVPTSSADPQRRPLRAGAAS